MLYGLLADPWERWADPEGGLVEYSSNGLAPKLQLVWPGMGDDWGPDKNPLTIF